MPGDTDTGFPRLIPSSRAKAAFFAPRAARFLRWDMVTAPCNCLHITNPNVPQIVTRECSRSAISTARVLVVPVLVKSGVRLFASLSVALLKRHGNCKRNRGGHIEEEPFRNLCTDHCAGRKPTSVDGESRRQGRETPARKQTFERPQRPGLAATRRIRIPYIWRRRAPTRMESRQEDWLGKLRAPSRPGQEVRLSDLHLSRTPLLLLRGTGGADRGPSPKY